MAADADMPARRDDLAEDAAHQRRLAGARLSDEVDELPALYVEVYVLKRHYVGLENFGDAGESYVHAATSCAAPRPAPPRRRFPYASGRSTRAARPECRC